MSETIAPESNELQPHETVRVVLDGRTLKRVRIDAPVLSRADASVDRAGARDAPRRDAALRARGDRRAVLVDRLDALRARR